MIDKPRHPRRCTVTNPGIKASAVFPNSDRYAGNLRYKSNGPNTWTVSLSGVTLGTVRKLDDQQYLGKSDVIFNRLFKAVKSFAK